MYGQLRIRQQCATFLRKRSRIQVANYLATSREVLVDILNVTFQDFTSWRMGRERERRVISYRRNKFHSLTCEEDKEEGGGGGTKLLLLSSSSSLLTKDRLK